MVVGLYVLKDVKLDRFQPPFVARDDNEARIIISRAGFSKAVYPDLDLYKLCDFDDNDASTNFELKRIGTIPMRSDDE